MISRWRNALKLLLEIHDQQERSPGRHPCVWHRTNLGTVPSAAHDRRTIYSRSPLQPYSCGRARLLPHLSLMPLSHLPQTVPRRRPRGGHACNFCTAQRGVRTARCRRRLDCPPGLAGSVAGSDAVTAQPCSLFWLKARGPRPGPYPFRRNLSESSGYDRGAVPPAPLVGLCHTRRRCARAELAHSQSWRLTPPAPVAHRGIFCGSPQRDNALWLHKETRCFRIE